MNGSFEQACEAAGIREFEAKRYAKAAVGIWLINMLGAKGGIVDNALDSEQAYKTIRMLYEDLSK